MRDPPPPCFRSGMDRDMALQGLVDKGVLTPEQADAVRDALRDETSGTPQWLAEAAGYVGGVLMLGGAGILLGTQWEAMTRTARGASLGGITLTLLLVAALLAAGRTPVRRRVASVLVAIASGTAAFTAGVIAAHWAGTAAGLTGLIVAILGYAVLRSPILLLAMGAHSIVVAAAVPADGWTSNELAMTLVFLAVGAVWFALALANVLTPVPVALGIGGTIALIGGQIGLTVDDAPWWGYGTTFAVALVCFAVYSVRRWPEEIADRASGGPGERSARRSPQGAPSWHRTPVLLVGGVVGMALAAPEAVWSWTDGAAGGAVILLVAGAALIGASALGLLVRRIIAGPDGQPSP